MRSRPQMLPMWPYVYMYMAVVNLRTNSKQVTYAKNQYFANLNIYTHLATDASCPDNFFECQLIEALFENYTTRARPVVTPSDTLQINGSYFMRSVSKIVSKTCKTLITI